MTIHQYLEEIKNTSGSKAKLALLKEALKSHPVLERVIHMILSTELQYGIKKIPTYEKAPHITTELSEALDFVESKFATNEVTGNARIEELTLLLSYLSEDDAKVLERVIKKNLDCGINTTNANKVLKTPIPTFNVMLCSSKVESDLELFCDEPHYLVGQPVCSNGKNHNVICQDKSDGMRIIISVDKNGKVVYRSRNGKELELAQKHNILFSSFPLTVFDGEALIMRDGEILDRKTGNGIMNKVSKGTASQEEVESVHLTLWDVIDYDAFFMDAPSEPYIKRLDKLVSMLGATPIVDFISYPEGLFPDSMDDIQDFYNSRRAQGKEGIIVKLLDKPYEPKRVKHQMKMKAVESLDLRVKGFNYGTPGSKYDGLIGALVCESDDGIIQATVGSGLTDAQRKHYTENFNELLDKIVEIEYNDAFENNGKVKLYLLTLSEIRFDKDETSTVSDIPVLQKKD